MGNLDVLIFLLVQPGFTTMMLYTLVTSSVVCILSQLFLANRPRAKSLIYLLPLFASLAPFLLYPDPLLVWWQMVDSAGTQPNILTINVHTPTGTPMPLVFGLLSLIGLTASIGYLIVMYTKADRIVSSLCRVTQLRESDEPQLFALVNRLSRRMQVPQPKIGITEDLRPNAFTFGHGRGLTLVCSLGLLQLLNKREMEAALAHELAHVKNKDFNFKAVTSALKIALFYNPLVYLLSAAISRQREILADDIGANVLSTPEYLGRALARIAEASVNLPSQGFGWQIASSLFIMSPARKFGSALSCHPPMLNRLRHLIDREPAERMGFQQILLLLVSFAFLATISFPVYQTISSFTTVNLANGDSGLVARGASGLTMPQFLSVVLGPFPLQPFFLTLQRATIQDTTGFAFCQQGAGVSVWYTASIYPLLLAIANIGLAIAVLIGAFRPAKGSQRHENVIWKESKPHVC